MLSVKNLIHTIFVQHEVYQPQRITLQQGLHDGNIFLAITIDVISLVLWLNDKLPAKSEQPLALVLVIDKALADIANSPICMKCCNHISFLFSFAPDENPLI